MLLYLEVLLPRQLTLPSIQKSCQQKTGFLVSLHFIISQDLRDIELLKSFINFLDCGRIKSNSKQSWVQFIVTKSGDVLNKVIPFFDKYSIEGVKAKDFESFKQAAKIIESKSHLSIEGLEQIRLIKAGMNKNRSNLEDSPLDYSIPVLRPPPINSPPLVLLPPI